VSASIKAFRTKLDLTSEKVSYKEVGSRDIIDLYEICFFEYGWSYEAILEMPIPAFLETIEALKRRKNKEKEAYENARKKGKKKGR
jgi:hypothetical protein